MLALMSLGQIGTEQQVSRLAEGGYEVRSRVMVWNCLEPFSGPSQYILTTKVEEFDLPDAKVLGKMWSDSLATVLERDWDEDCSNLYLPF
jgi:hypothetical protein